MFIVVDLREGKIIGGIDVIKAIKNYIYIIQFIINVNQYEVNLKVFKNILNY